MAIARIGEDTLGETPDYITKAIENAKNSPAAGPIPETDQDKRFKETWGPIFDRLSADEQKGLANANSPVEAAIIMFKNVLSQFGISAGEVDKTLQNNAPRLGNSNTNQVG